MAVAAAVQITDDFRVGSVILTADELLASLGTEKKYQMTHEAGGRNSKLQKLQTHLMITVTEALVNFEPATVTPSTKAETKAADAKDNAANGDTKSPQFSAAQ